MYALTIEFNRENLASDSTPSLQGVYTIGIGFSHSASHCILDSIAA